MHGILALVTVPLLINEIIASPSNSTLPSLNPIIISANYEQLYSNLTNHTNEYVFLYKNNSLTEAARIKVSSNATEDLPLIIVVRQRKGILSWQIPLLVQSAQDGPLSYNQTSRTLCSTKYYLSDSEDEVEFVSISVSTASHKNVSFDLMVSIVTDFFIRPDGVPVTKQIAPAEPIYFGYEFPEQMDTSSVIVEVDSDNDVCMTVSIQNNTCPVFDLERNIEFSGYWQTVSRQGGITIPREAYPSGFFIVLVVKADDTDCYGSPSRSLVRNKKITLSVYKSITKKDWIVASIASLALIMGFCLFYIVGIIIYKIRENRRLGTILNDVNSQMNESIQSPSVGEEFQVGPSQVIDDVQEDSSLDEDDIDLLEDAQNDKDIVRTKPILSVCDLARKHPKILRHKSQLYLYYLATVAIFYTLPVVQLVVTYQHMLHITGNQDMCYYNFLCAHPFGSVSDFNHVFSNFGYVALGMLFVFITYSREHNETDAEMNKCYGIPQHFGLFYSMGFALMMEGVLSASYHVCPNRSNFQFDSSFMYIIAVLCMIKIYQTRHPDINARAPATFGILAIVILLSLIGVLDGSVYFWVAFSIIHLVACLLLTGQIYYVGRWKFNRGLLIRIVQKLKYDASVGILHLLKPVYWRRFVLLMLANLCNIGLVVWGNIDHRNNFATYLLAILMSNLILYTFFYIIMKLCHGEKLLLQPLIYLTLSMIFWGLALYFFVNKTISWALTPAQSRIYNKPCELLRFFDSHDIWHFLSAFAMFFSFMVLLTMDDDLVEVHRSQIQVF